MNKRRFYFFVVLLVMAMPAVFAQSKTTVKITAISPVVPAVKRVDQNLLIQIRVYVPAGKTVTYKQLQLSFDKVAVASIAKLELYNANTETVLNKSAVLLTSTETISTTTLLPVDLAVKPGIVNLLVSVKLKDNAKVGTKFFAKATQLVTAKNEKHLVVEKASSATVKTSNIHRIADAVRLAGEDNVHSYRIPGMITTDKGTLITVYDIRYKHSGDLPANIDVGMSRSTDGGQTWEPMKIIMDMGEPHENNGIGDPAILFDPVTKKLWVAALWSKGNRSIAGSKPGLSPDTTGQFVLVSSDDDGVTWSKPYSITEQIKNPAWHLYFNGPGNGIAMQNGTLVFPSQYWDETTKPSSVGIPHSSIIYSNDHGKTWKSGVGAKSNTTEAQVVETTPGTLMLNMRDNRGRYRSVATTTDMGQTWTEHATSYEALPDPVCQASIIKARVNVKGQMKDVLFFSNVNSDRARINTTVKASLDMGETWLPANELLIDARGSWGYSVLSKINDHTLGLFYEGTGAMYFISIPVSDIIK
nr:sialidase family protein [uncultured Lacibacter sp.]